MSAFVDAVRSASRTRRYARLRRSERSGVRGDLVRALLTWGVAALAPLLAALAVAMGRDAGLVEISVALLLTVAVAHVTGRPRMRAFDLLHQPTRRGLVLGHVIYRMPFYVWAGLLSGAAWWIVMPWLPEHIGGVLALGAVVLAPLAFGVNAGATKVAGRAGSEEAAWMLPVILPVIGVQIAKLWLDAMPWTWLLPAVGCVAGLVVVARAHVLMTALRKSCALLLVALVFAIPAAPRGPAFVDDSAMWVATGATTALACVVVLVLSLRTQIVRIEFAEVVATRVGAEGDVRLPQAATPLASPPSGPPRRTRVGRGLWSARLNYLRDAWLPEREPDAGWRGVVRRWSGTGTILLVTVLRGPILATTAVVLATDDATLVFCAVLAGCCASRWSAVDSIALQPRLWLLGVDYRDQVLQGLRALGVCAALPTLGVALVTLAVAGPGAAGRQASVMMIAATFLVRAGLPGLWPLQETHRMRLLGFWAIAFAALTGVAFIMRDWWWPSRDAVQVAGIACAAGLVLLVVRLVRLREPHLRECVRRAVEP